MMRGTINYYVCVGGLTDRVSLSSLPVLALLAHAWLSDALLLLLLLLLLLMLLMLLLQCINWCGALSSL